MRANESGASEAPNGMGSRGPLKGPWWGFWVLKLLEAFGFSICKGPRKVLLELFFSLNSLPTGLFSIQIWEKHILIWPALTTHLVKVVRTIQWYTSTTQIKNEETQTCKSCVMALLAKEHKLELLLCLSTTRQKIQSESPSPYPLQICSFTSLHIHKHNISHV